MQFLITTYILYLTVCVGLIGLKDDEGITGDELLDFCK